jgi:hypothetical protein
VGLFGPTNLTDLTAARQFTTASTQPISGCLAPPTIGDGKYVNPSVLAVWQPTRHVQLQGVITRFISGKFLEDSFVSSGFGFYSGTVVYRF